MLVKTPYREAVDVRVEEGGELSLGLGEEFRYT
jgi:hypothetical protein